MKAILTKGSGYWDTTDYGYRMSFRRAATDILVVLTGKRIKNDLEFSFEANGKTRTGYSSVLLDLNGGSVL